MARTTYATRSAGDHVQMHTESRLPVEAVIVNVIYFIFSLIEGLLAIRFALALFGANRTAPFVQFIYNVTGPLLAPFEAVFRPSSVSGATFEWSTLLAIAVYALMAWALTALVRAVSPRESARTIEQVEQVDRADNVAAATNHDHAEGPYYAPPVDQQVVEQRVTGPAGTEERVVERRPVEPGEPLPPRVR